MRSHQQQLGSHGLGGTASSAGGAATASGNNRTGSNKTGLGLDLAGLSGSISSSYQVPSVDGRLIQATPLSFCLKYRPPTIAVVYKIEKRPSSTMNSKTSKTDQRGKIKKYIHEIVVEAMLVRTVDLNELCLKLCERESAYLNPTIISKTQVLDLLTKLYKHKHGSLPASISTVVEPAKDSPKMTAAAAPAHKSQADKNSNKVGESAPEPTQKRIDTKSSKNAFEDEDYDDDWDMLVDEPGADKNKNQVLAKRSAAAAPDNKVSNLFEQKASASLDDFDDLEGIPTIKDAVVAPASRDTDDDEDYLKHNDNDNSDEKLEQQLHQAQEIQGLVDQEENTSSNNNIFDTSKDKIKPGSTKPSANPTAAGAANGSAPEDDEAQIAVEIEEQFQVLYDGDPELRKVLEKSDVRTFTVQEKYQIIDAYMAGGGAQGLQIELDEGENENEAIEDMDDVELEFDEATIEQMPEESKRRLEAQFLQLYTQDESFRAALGEQNTPEQLNLFSKYQIMMEYGKSAAGAGAVNASGMSETREGDVVVVNGKQYTRVQIEGHNEEFLMDENTNIYDMQLNLVGIQGDSDEEDGQ